MRKRDLSDTLVSNTTGPGCFGGLISCSTQIGSENGTCINHSASSSSNSTSKRATNCNDVPAMFCNCGGDFFKRVTVANQNQDTMQLSSGTTFISEFSVHICRLFAHKHSGICENIQNYIQPRLGPNFDGGPNWMALEYVSEFENGGANRAIACGGTGNGTEQCAAIQASLWPTQVQQAKAQGANAPIDYQLMPGYSNTISCDEFPCKWPTLNLSSPLFSFYSRLTREMPSMGES